METEIVQEQATFLPNPDVVREPIIEACEGCNKVYDKMPKGNCVIHESFIRYVCIAYVSPSAMQRNGGCALQSNREMTIEEKKKINPIKWSKGRR